MEVLTSFTGTWLAQRDEGLQRIIQLIALALFIGGPMLAQLLRRLLSGARPPAKPAAPPRRAAPTPAEEQGKDLWRQLMELEEDEAVDAPAPQRRPADPLADPDVERTVPRPRVASAPIPQAEPVPRQRPSTANEAQAEARRPVLAAVPSEDELEAVAGQVASPSPMTALSVVGPPQLVERSRDARFASPTRDELRRALVLSEVLGVPVGLRPAGRGGHDPHA